MKELGQCNPGIEAQEEPKPGETQKSKLVLFADMMSLCHFVIFQAGVMLISLRSVSRPDIISNNIFSQILEAFLCKGFDWKSGNQLNTSLDFD